MKRTNDFWREKVKQLTVNNDDRGVRFGPESVLSSLQAEFESMPEDDKLKYGKPPSKASIGRIQHEARNLPKEERERYLWFFWPESMGGEDLPWEASATALELLRFLDSAGWLDARPSLRVMKWFVRVSQAGPGSGLAGRIMSAVDLTLDEENAGKQDSAGTAEGRKGIEWWLAYRPWEDIHHSQSYRKAITREKQPIPPMSMVGHFGDPEPAAENAAELRDWMERRAGGADSFRWFLIKWILAGRYMRSEEING